MVEEQARPLHSPNTGPTPTPSTKPRCCTTPLICSLCTLLFLLIITIIVLFLTIFKVKEPIMTLNKITLKVNPNATTNGGSAFLPGGSNISMTADVSVENPNRATFKFSNTTSIIYYRGIMVGEAYGPSGQARALHTMRMNVTVEIITERVIMAPNLSSDLGSGLFSMDSYTRVPGRVKMLLIIKRNVVVEMNCTIAYNITSQEIQDQSCKRHVHL